MAQRNVWWGLAMVVICILAFIWPVAVLVNRIEPMFLGMPFFMFWQILWVLLTVGVLAFLHWVLKI